ncbi:MAG: hypothetical protein LC803_08990 [Acidobacteria bacterium]|nr:hypothetical protein [Acidobacteriota bacterium]
MNRKLTTVLASAALLVFVSAPGTQTHAQSTQQDAYGNERTGQKETREIQATCPVHSEIKARTAEKCPKCRIESRKQQAARAKGNNKVQPRPQQATDSNE